MTPHNAASAATTAGTLATKPPHAVKTRHHLARAVRLNPAEIRHAMAGVEGFREVRRTFITEEIGAMVAPGLPSSP